MSKIDYLEAGTSSQEQVRGSDGRLNVTSRSNLRSFYVSRDAAQVYNVASIDPDAAAGDFIFYLQNTATDGKDIYIDAFNVSATNGALLEVHKVTGIASGTALTAANLNFKSGNTAAANIFGNAAVSGLTSSIIVAPLRVATGGTIQQLSSGVLILGQNDALAVQYTSGTTGLAEVGVRFFFE